MSRGPLMIIGGAEDKLRKRTILKDFVAAAGGPDARIAVIPTASSLGDEIVEVYDALFRGGRGRGVRRAPGEPGGGPRPGPRRAPGAGHRGLHDRRQPAQASLDLCGTPLGDAIVAAHHRGAVVGGTSAGASIQSTHMVAFGVGGATPKQRMTQVAAGLGLLPQHGHRPALRPAQPLRPAADDRRPVPAAARHRRRRGHLRHVIRRGRTRCCAWSAAARSRSSTPAHRHQRLRGQAVLAPAGQRGRAARAAAGCPVRPRPA